MKRTICFLLLAVLCSAAAQTICLSRSGVCPTHRLVFPYQTIISCRTDCDCGIGPTRTWKCCAVNGARFCLPPCNIASWTPCRWPTVCTLITQVHPWVSQCL